MIRIAVVGLGWWGRHLAGKIEESSVLELGVTVDPDPDAGARLRDVGDALADPDIHALALCVPHAMHLPLIVEAAGAGKHVFCEKPLTLLPSDARAAVQACRDAGVVLGVGHERRFEDPWRLVRAEVEAGLIGEVLHADAALHHDKFLGLPADHWRGSLEHSPAAGLTAMGVHLTDILISILGQVDEVYGRSERRVLEIPCGDVLNAQLRFRAGALASVSVVSATPFYGRLALFGSHGWIEVRDDGHPEVAAGATVTRCRRGGVPWVVHVEGATDAVRANLEAFAAAVEGREPYPFTDRELIHNVAVADAIVRSCRSGAPVGGIDDGT